MAIANPLLTNLPASSFYSTQNSNWCLLQTLAQRVISNSIFYEPAVYTMGCTEHIRTAYVVYVYNTYTRVNAMGDLSREFIWVCWPENYLVAILG